MINNKNKGFTLVEMLVYVALLSVIVLLSSGVVGQLLKMSSSFKGRVEAEGEANFLMRKLAWGMTGMSAVNSPASGETGTTLSVDKYNFADNPIVFSLSSNDLMITTGTGSPTVLNSAAVPVQNITFEHLPATTKVPDSVMVTLQIDGRDYSTVVYVKK